MAVEQEKSIEQIKKLEQFLSEKSKEEMAQILAYGEEMKKRGEERKKQFWSRHDRADFKRLLNYWRYQDIKQIEKIRSEYMYLDNMNTVERKKFIEEYLYDDILYSGEPIGTGFKTERFSYNEWKRGHAEIKEGVELLFSCDSIGIRELEDIAKIKLKEFVTLNLNGNRFGPKGARILAENLEFKNGVTLTLNGNIIGVEGVRALSNIKLKCGVDLDLSNNEIGDEGVEILINNLKLEEGVRLRLDTNQIGPEGAKVIAENMKFKYGMYLSLRNNQIGDEGVKALSHMEFKERVSLNLGENQIGDEGEKAIANMELKEGMTIDLSRNHIGYMGVRAILNMKLKNGMFIDLSDNKIGKTMKSKLESWVKSYKNCGVRV